MPVQSARRPLLIRLAGLVALLLLVAVLGACSGDDDGGGGGNGGGGSVSGDSASADDGGGGNHSNDSNDSREGGGGGSSGSGEGGADDGGDDGAGAGGDDGGGSGDGRDSAQAFCGDVKAALVSDNKGGGDLQQQARRFKDAIAKLQKIDPPEEIAKDWNAVVGIWSGGGAEQVDIQAAQKSSQRISAYMREECNLAGR
jgi:hypothetical protein